nr:hypothetical protein [Deltaproteobacteria bacterium]
MTPPTSRPGALVFVAVVYAVAASVAALSVPVSREAVRSALHRLRLRWSPPPAAL